MHMNLDSQRLLKLLKDFYILTNIKIVVFDADYQEILAYPDNHCSFCALMHQHQNTKKYCLQSNLRSFESSKKKNALVLYRCHAGLIEATAPLKTKGRIIGYCMFGQITDDPDARHISRHLEGICHKYGLPLPRPATSGKTDTLSGPREKHGDHVLTFSDMNYKIQEQISAAASILEACASYVLMKDLIEIGQTPFVAQIDSYIQEHIQEEILVQELSDYLDMSRSKLYELTAKYLGMGLAQYILLQRMELAKKYLSETNLSIATIASDVGFSDYNYFCKVFRKKTGLTPKQYRKQRSS